METEPQQQRPDVHALLPYPGIYELEGAELDEYYRETKRLYRYNGERARRQFYNAQNYGVYDKNGRLRGAVQMPTLAFITIYKWTALALIVLGGASEWITLQPGSLSAPGGTIVAAFITVIFTCSVLAFINESWPYRKYLFLPKRKRPALLANLLSFPSDTTGSDVDWLFTMTQLWPTALDGTLPHSFMGSPGTPRLARRYRALARSFAKKEVEFIVLDVKPSKQLLCRGKRGYLR